MKRLISLILSILMLISLVSCASSLDTGVTEENETKTEEQSDKAQEEDGPIVYPDTFSAGFAREDVSPYGYEVRMNSTSTAKSVEDPIYASCVAISDGEEVVLFFSLDIRNTTKGDQMKKVVSKATGIPEDNMFFTATHNHSCPDPTSGGSDVTRWYKDFYASLTKAAKDAMRDLAPAEIYIGKTTSPEGTNFVRRYQRADGSWDGIHNANTSTSPVTSYESEADKELRTIRFERGEKKDILLANWQAHAAHALTGNHEVITADFITNLRKGVEKDMDVHFAYYQGAAGDINFSSQMNDKKYSGWAEIGEVLVDVVKEAVSAETRAESGKIKVTTSVVNGVVQKDPAERVAQAKEVNGKTGDEYNALLSKYGFASKYEVSFILKRAEMGETSEIPLTAISFGDVGFVSAPYEMFNTNGVQLRAASPFKMTFNCSYTNGACGYMPSSEAFPHGGYEVYTCYFVQGTGEICVNESVRLLTEQYNAK